MRWEALFADLAAEFDAADAAERHAEVADRTRAELGRIRLIDRLQPLVGSSGTVRLGLCGDLVATGVVRSVGIDWLLMAEEAGRQRLVALDAVQWIRGVFVGTAEPGWEGRVGAKLTLRSVLRRLMRDRLAVTVALTSGDSIVGRLEQVGADHVQLSASDGARQGAGGAGEATLIPISAIACVATR